MTSSKIIKDILLMMALLMLLSSCTNDGRSADGEMLPEGKYPLVISSVSIEGESIERPWGAVPKIVEEDDGESSVWEWNGMETIGVQLGDGDETANYTLQSDKTLTPDKQLYWKSTSTAAITAWYPTDTTVDLSDQSKVLSYVLKAEENASYTDTISLDFEHQLAKVQVMIEGPQADEVTQVDVYNYTSCSNTNGTVSTAEGDEGWIKMKAQTYNGAKCWEANVVPGTISKVRLNGSAENTLSSSFSAVAGHLQTIALMVGEQVTNITTENCTGISDTDKYRISGQFNHQITITGGSPTIYLENAVINVSDGSAISVTGGSPIIHVVGTGNSVSSGNDTGIAVSNGATVTIQGNSIANVLTATGGFSGSAGSATVGAGIGSPIDGMQGGNIIIHDLTIHATGGNINNTGGGAGIGSSTNGACGHIKIENAVIYATGGYFAAGIGMGCNYQNSSSPTASIGNISISDSYVKASGGSGAAAIGFSMSETLLGGGNYRAGKITIKTADESGFLSGLTSGMNPGTSYTAPQRIGKGAYTTTHSFQNTADSGPWEGVVINDKEYKYGVD